jgi:hypothetical protein
METDYSTSKFSIPYGAILGLVITVLAVSMYVSGMLLSGDQWPIYIFYLFFPIFIGYCVYSYRNKNAGFLGLGQAIKVGVTVAVVGGIVYGIYNLIFFYFIEPDITDQLMEVARAKMFEENPNMKEEEAEMALSFVKKFSNPLFSSAMYILLSAVFGFLYGLISGAIFKRERPILG